MKRMPQADTHRENRLLESLPQDERLRLARLCEPVELPVKFVMIGGSKPVEYVYFLSDGLASAVTSFADGGTIEASSIGREGCVGITEFLGVTPENLTIFQQVAGRGLRMRTDVFRSEAERSDAFRDVLRRYAGLTLSESMQSTACNRLHEAEPRCARWLLLTAERLGRSEFSLTHEFLAQMLGTSRPAVSTIVGKLEASGLLSQGRGHLKLDNPEGLEEVACECYDVLSRQLREFAGALELVS